MPSWPGSVGRMASIFNRLLLSAGASLAEACTGNNTKQSIFCLTARCSAAQCKLQKQSVEDAWRESQPAPCAVKRVGIQTFAHLHATMGSFVHAFCAKGTPAVVVTVYMRGARTTKSGCKAWHSVTRDVATNTSVMLRAMPV